MCALTDEMIYAFIHKTPTEKGAVWTNTAPSSKKPNLLDLIRAAKNKLVQAQRYDDAKDLRDIERLLMEEISGNPVTFGDIESMLSDVRDAKNAASRAEEGVGLIEQRIEKMEEALSKEMAKTREMDDILAGVVKYVGYTSSAPVRVSGSGAWRIGSSTNDGGLAFINIDPKASPSGIPFSVALEYLKAGRKVRRPGMGNGYIHQVLGSYGAHWGTEKPFCAIQVIEAGLMTSDWMVLPESTK